MTTPERREKARLRSERWRRAHGIMPRRPAQRPWEAMRISRSTYTTGGAPKPVRKPPWQAKAKGVVKSVLATEWERSFAQGLLARWHGPLTEKQAEVLERVWTKCCGREARAA